MRAYLAVALLASAPAASGNPIRVAAGGEVGGYIGIRWLGTAVEIEIPLTDTVSARALGRWQHLDDETDECGLNFVGRQLDASVGVRWNLRDRGRDAAMPFVAATAGAGQERTRNTCPGPGPTKWNVTTTMIATLGGGVDIPISDVFAVRIEGRLALGNFRDGGSAATVTNHELSAAISLAASF